MTAAATQQIAKAWDDLNTLVPVSPIHTERQYDQAVEKLNELLDIVGDNESHPLYDLLDTLGLIHAYEENHCPAPAATGKDVLKYIIDEHRLSLSSFPEIGDEHVISELLAGAREFNVSEIRALSNRFGLSPATFV